MVTVQDMIDELQKHDKDLVVVTDDDYDNFGDPERYVGLSLSNIRTIWLRKNYEVFGCGKVWRGMSRTKPENSGDYIRVVWIR